jgi:hypothetical protein
MPVCFRLWKRSLPQMNQDVQCLAMLSSSLMFPQLGARRSQLHERVLPSLKLELQMQIHASPGLERRW